MSMRPARVLGNAALIASLVVAWSGVLAGCGDGEVGAETTTAGSTSSASTSTSSSSSSTGTGGPTAMARIRVIHASPDAPAVDVYAKGVADALLTGVSFGSASEYLEVEPGSYDLELRASPSTADDPVAYSTGAIPLEEGAKVSAIAAGRLTSTGDGDKFRVLALAEGFAPAGSGSAIARIVHAGADAPSVGIDLGADDPSSPEITGLDRFEDTGVAGVPLGAGAAHPIGIAAAGAMVTTFTTPELPEGAELFVIATGLLGKLAREADGFALLAVGPDGAIGFVKQDPVVYALHASPDAPEVDLFAGGAELVDGIAFGELSSPLRVPPGSYTIDFHAHEEGSSPSGAPAASAATGELARGERYLAIATGFLAPGAAQPLQLLGVSEGFDLADPANARLRVVHASPDAPMVDLGILNAENVVAPVLVQDVAFKSSSAPAGLFATPGTLPLGVTPASDNAAVVASFHVTTTPGVRAFAVAAGALDAASGQSFRLLAVDTAATPWTVATIQPQPQ